MIVLRHRCSKIEVRSEATHKPEGPGPDKNVYRGTSLIRNSPPPLDHHRALAIVLL
jgi:hypothetical protein